MDRLRQDIRAVFSRQQAGLGDLGGERQRVLQTALEKRAEPIGPRTQLLAGIAAVLLAALVVATFAYVRAGNRTHSLVPPVASPVRTNPPSSGLHRVSIDLLDSGRAWALLTNCDVPNVRMCNYFVSATADGGNRWSTPARVGPSYQPSNGDAPRVIRFLNGNDGFVYGGSIGLMTHDGGQTWTGLGFQPVFVNGIIGSGQAAWAFTYPCPKGTLCSYEERITRDGGRTWSAGQPLPLGFSPFDAVIIGMGNARTSELLVSSTAGDMVITSNGGKTFRSIPSQCKDNPFRSWVATSDGNELWVLCAGYPLIQPAPTSQATPTAKPTSSATGPDSSPKALYVSQDGGLTWSRKATSQAGGKLPTGGMQGAIVSTRLHTLLLAVDPSPVLITTDAGSNWTQVPTPPAEGVLWFRFFNQTTGWAIGALGGVWWTTDGGLSWTRLSSYDAS